MNRTISNRSGRAQYVIMFISGRTPKGAGGGAGWRRPGAAQIRARQNVLLENAQKKYFTPVEFQVKASYFYKVDVSWKSHRDRQAEECSCSINECIFIFYT